MTRSVRALALSLTLLTPLTAGMAVGQQATDAIDPETAGALGVQGLSEMAMGALATKAEGRPVIAEDWMIAAANPLAVEAGAEVLAQGGSAADAMVAAQAVLGLVEPQSSGLGGGAFLVWFDANTGEVTTLDGRETAPLDVTPTLFQQDGETMGFWDAVVGGRSVGTPGTPALMAEAHAKWGTQPWAGLFGRAIQLADQGFAVSERMAGAIASDAERLSTYPATAAYFLPGGTPLAAGGLLRNPDYAQTLRLIAAHGADAFYTGPIADDIVATVRTAAGNPGSLGPMDLALYRVKERPAVCVAYGAHDVCGMGPPSSGALTVGQILGTVAASGVDMAALGPQSAEAWRVIGEASRLAFADRGRYMADSDFVPVPTEGLVAPDYLAERAALIPDQGILEDVSPGKPEFDHALNWADDDALEFPSTSHISIVDAAGNALSMTTTIENGFGSRLMVRGFLLNNEMTDFSFRSHSGGTPIANRVEPGKRPRSSMSPTIVLRDGEPNLVVGSPGGSRIIGYVAKTIIANLDWNMHPQAAIDLPNLVNRFGTFDVEAGTDAETIGEGLAAAGYEVNVRGLNSGVHAIKVRRDGVLAGGADSRREGIALGQ